jgi:hypothetical protein
MADILDAQLISESVNLSQSMISQFWTMFEKYVMG